jgi:hydrogenase maturation protease
MPQMKKILVIGYGNTVRGDDAAGIQAAELIAKRHPEIQCVCMHQLMPEMAEQIAECDIVFFVDADANASRVTSRLIGSANETEQPRTHFISPESLLSLSRQLYQRIPHKAFIIGIPASEFEFSEELSEKTSLGIEDCVKEVEKLAGL